MSLLLLLGKGEAAPDILTGLELYYKLNGNLTDSCGHSSASWAAGAASYGTGYLGAQAAQIETGDRIDTPAIGTSYDDMTFSFWIKPLNNGANWDNTLNWAAFLVTRGGYGSGYTSIRAFDWYGACYVTKWGGTGDHWFADQNHVPANAWTHLAITFDKTNSVIKEYVNGSERSGDRLSESLIAPLDNGWSIGDADYGGQQYKGLIEQVRIYSRVLSDADITLLYNYTEPAATGILLRRRREAMLC